MKSPEEIKLAVAQEEFTEFLTADGFDGAFIGMTEQQPDRPAVAVYDKRRCLHILMERDSMSLEDAVEHFGFNVSGAWHGEMTPIFLDTLDW